MSTLLASLSYKEAQALCASFRPSDVQVAGAKARVLRNEADEKHGHAASHRRHAARLAREARAIGERDGFKGDAWRQAFSRSLQAAQMCRHFETLFARADRKARDWERLAARLEREEKGA